MKRCMEDLGFCISFHSQCGAVYKKLSMAVPNITKEDHFSVGFWPPNIQIPSKPEMRAPRLMSKNPENCKKSIFKAPYLENCPFLSFVAKDFSDQFIKNYNISKIQLNSRKAISHIKRAGSFHGGFQAIHSVSDSFLEWVVNFKSI